MEDFTIIENYVASDKDKHPPQAHKSSKSVRSKGVKWLVDHLRRVAINEIPIKNDKDPLSGNLRKIINGAQSSIVPKLPTQMSDVMEMPYNMVNECSRIVFENSTPGNDDPSIHSFAKFRNTLNQHSLRSQMLHLKQEIEVETDALVRQAAISLEIEKSFGSLLERCVHKLDQLYTEMELSVVPTETIQTPKMTSLSLLRSYPYADDIFMDASSKHCRQSFATKAT
jgi:hypothetical protein